MSVQPLSKVLGKDHPARAGQQPFVPADVITSDVLLERFENLFNQLTSESENVERCANAVIEAEYRYDAEYAKTRIKMEARDGTVDYKESKAVEATLELKRDLGYAKQALKAAKKAEELVSQKVSALQTVAANAREEMKLAGRIDPSERTG